MQRSPLAKIFGQLSMFVVVFGGLAGLVFDWRLLLMVPICIYAGLAVINAIEGAAIELKHERLNPDKQKKAKRN